MHLEAFPQAAQDRHRVLHGRLLHQYRLETSFKRRILLDVLAVFVQRGGADAVQFTARQHRFQHVAGIHRPLGLAGPDDRVEFVYEQNDAPLGLLDLVQHSLETFLEFTAVLGAGHQRSHIQRKDGLILESLRNVAAYDALRQSFHDGGLADSRLTDQHRIVLGLAG